MWLIFYCLGIFFRSLGFFFRQRTFLQIHKIMRFKSGIFILYAYVHGFLMRNVKILWLKLDFSFHKIMKLCPKRHQNIQFFFHSLELVDLLIHILTNSSYYNKKCVKIVANFHDAFIYSILKIWTCS